MHVVFITKLSISKSFAKNDGTATKISNVRQNKENKKYRILCAEDADLPLIYTEKYNIDKRAVWFAFV